MEDVVVCFTKEEAETYRKIAEKAWDEGHSNGWNKGPWKNPYRKKGQE